MSFSISKFFTLILHSNFIFVVRKQRPDWCIMKTYRLETLRGVMKMDGKKRTNIKIGMRVSIVMKQDQSCGNLTEGYVAKILTNSPNHPHGIKVKLEDGAVGRVKAIHS